MKWNVSASKEEIALLMEAGLIYRDMKRFEAARQVLEAVQALIPASEVPEVALGTVAFQSGSFETAIECYQRALAQNPASSYALAHLGEAHLFRMDRARAKTCLENAIQLDPRGDSATFARRLLQLSEVVRFAGE